MRAGDAGEVARDVREGGAGVDRDGGGVEEAVVVVGGVGEVQAGGVGVAAEEVAGLGARGAGVVEEEVVRGLGVGGDDEGCF